jgi:hypothetical protein
MPKILVNFAFNGHIFNLNDWMLLHMNFSKFASEPLKSLIFFRNSAEILSFLETLPALMRRLFVKYLPLAQNIKSEY